MSEHSNDCYLCGAQNDADASFCKRCDGQLLRLESSGPEPEPAAIAEETENTETEESSSDKGSMGKLRGLRRGSTLEDSRLSDALGLGDSTSNELISHEVTAVPRAQQAADIPLIGTRTGALTQRPLRQEEPGRRVWILLGLLVLVTAWVGWNALKPSGPESLAFGDQSTPTTSSTSTTTTTTTIPRREWNASEVEGVYGDAFVIVELIECTTDEDGEPTEAGTAQSIGITIDQFTTLIDMSPLPGADVAQVFTRRGAARGGALLGSSEYGADIAVFPVARTSDLRVGTEPTSEARFFLHFNEEDLMAPVVESDIPDLPQIAVTSQGDLVSTRIGGQTFSSVELEKVVDSVQLREDETAQADPCSWPDAFEFAKATPRNAPATGDASSQDAELEDQVEEIQE